MDELFFNNFSKIDGTNRFSINAGTYCMFSNLTFLFVWTNVYYSYCKMTPILISDNRFLSSELDLRALDMISTNALSPMLQRQPVPSSCVRPCDATCVTFLVGAVAEARCTFGFLCLCSFFILKWTTKPNVVFFLKKCHCWSCSFCLSLQWLCCREQGCEIACSSSSVIHLSASPRAITIQPPWSIRTTLRSA